MIFGYCDKVAILTVLAYQYCSNGTVKCSDIVTLIHFPAKSQYPIVSVKGDSCGCKPGLRRKSEQVRVTEQSILLKR